MASRFEVVTAIMAHIRRPDLLRNGVCVMDATLYELLLHVNEEVTRLNLQRFLKRHYPNKEGAI